MRAINKSLLTFVLCTLATTSVLAAPMHIVITVPQGAAGGANLPGLLAEWRQTGAVADAFLLASVQAKDPAFGSIAVLQFPDEASVEHWRQKGKSHLGAGVITTAVDTEA